MGDFPEYSYQEASEERKASLILLCRQCLTNLCGKHDLPILVTSDSQIFLESVKGMDGVSSFPSKVVHLDYVKDAPMEVYRKSFVDFYLIAESALVYCAGTTEMYKSNFPNYAAKVNAVPFERILIEG